ncbi:guanylate kinase [bacterium]|nr:guanylate kinase [bacterium]MDD5918025.1 guanylate kinase [bacterium]
MKANEGKGVLIVLSGPSGVGKGTVCKELLVRNPQVKLSVSATTRAPRPGEVEGVSYFFKTREEFERMIAAGEFLEYMDVFGMNYYGTPRAYVEQQLAAGNDIVLEIDVKGAMNVKRLCPEAVLVFIAPPSMETLKKRLVGRGTETAEAVERRTQEAFAEMKLLPEYDYAVVNDVLEDAVCSVETIIKAERLRVCRRADLTNF